MGVVAESLDSRYHGGKDPWHPRVDEREHGARDTYPRGEKDMRTFEFEDQYGSVTRVRLARHAYADGSLAVQMLSRL